MNNAETESTEDQPERGAFYTINWARKLPAFVNGRGEPDVNLRYLMLLMSTWATGRTGGDVRPTIETLVEYSALPESTVKDCLKRAQALGVLVKVGVNGHGVTCWRFDLDADFSEADTVESKAKARRERNRERQQRHRDKKRHTGSSVTSHGIERDSHTGSAVTSHGIGRDVTRDPAGTYQSPAQDLPVGDLPVYPPSLATASPNESAGTSTKLSKGGRAAVLARKDKARENYTESLAGTEYDPEPTWSLFLDAFTARTEAECTGWTIRDWVAKRMRAIITTTLMEHDRYRVDAAVVSCAREADKPYLDGAFQAWIATALVGPNMTRQEREARFGTSAVDKAPVEPEPTVVIPEQRQATMDTTPPAEEDAEPEVDEVDDDPDDDIFLIRPEGLDDIDDQDDDEPEDFRPMLNFVTSEDEPRPTTFEVPVIVADVIEGETYAEWSARQADQRPRSRKVAA